MGSYKSIFNEEHRGAVAIEMVIQFPLMFMTFLMLLYFFFTAFAYIYYNNLANMIAQDLNMRQTGYTYAYTAYPTCPVIPTGRVAVAGDSDIQAHTTLPVSSIGVNNAGGSPEVLRRGLYWAISSYGRTSNDPSNIPGYMGKMSIPFAELKYIDVESNKPITLGTERTYAGAVIKVVLTFKTMSITDPDSPSDFLNMYATGYAVID